MGNKEMKTADNRRAAIAFLSGRGSNPIPANKRRKAGPLETEFVGEAMREIAEQDREIERKSGPGVTDDLMTVMRLVSDNHEMIQLIQSRRIVSVSDLAVALGRELPNVSRTLSRMAAYGLVGFEENAGDARAKKPVWKLSVLPDHEGLDWIQAYCLAMALQKRTGIGMDSVHFSTMESAVRDAVASTVEQIDLTK
jgi:predicted transcriptional regulator